MIPQIIYICLTMIALGKEFAKHGQPKTGNYDGWSSIIAVIVISLVLYWGGFYDVFF